MTEDDINQIREAIERAYSLAEAGQPREAVLSFALARELAVSRPNKATLDQVVTRYRAGFQRERENHREAVRAASKGSRPLLILADSLGLPRVAAGTSEAVTVTYADLLAQRLPDRRVDSICQRFFTTDDVLKQLQDEPDLGKAADVVLHVGLNDRANRMFLERERLALDLLPEAVKMAIVGFSQRYRLAIIHNLPGHHYVPPDRFSANLDAILTLLAERKAGRVILSTIILPPMQRWPATPGINHSCAQYNLMIMEAAQRHGRTLLDIDRHVWRRIEDGVLLGDGMHLSTSGQDMMATEIATLLK